jgi:serine/threonine-protein kinase
MQSGQTIAGKYRLNQLLGNGGMASVWSATNIFTDRQIAMKFMLPSVARTPEAAKRFLMEAKVSARVDHPNIIEVIDVGQTEEGTLFLVIELLTGVPLEMALTRQSPRMSVHEFAVVMVQVARALAAAHRSGVVHRDLKPTNVFLHEGRDRQPIVKLLDFGISKFLEEEPTELTIAGTVLGSPFYMSPEQARGDEDLDERTDVYSFGAICFEALCGYRAYDALNFKSLLVKIATTAPKSIDDVAPDAPEVFRAIVRECMVVDRDKREVTMNEIALRLFAALTELETSRFRLPVPKGLEKNDPDATNLLPVIRPHDKPLPPSIPPPAPGSESSLGQRPSSGHARISGPSGPRDSARPAPRPRRRKSRSRPSGAVRWFIGGALATGLLLAGLIVWRDRQRGAYASPLGSPGSTTATEVRSATVVMVPPTATPSSEPPVVSIDTLPRAGGRVPVRPPPVATVDAGRPPGT